MSNLTIFFSMAAELLAILIKNLDVANLKVFGKEMVIIQFADDNHFYKKF